MYEFPRVSIVTPSFNQGKYLDATIRSVLEQDYPNLEYWVIDGGSTDDSLKIIQKYSNQLAGWVSEKDNGQADAINKGWLRATGDFLGWLNSDDLLTPGSISTAIRFFRDNQEIDFVFGDLDHIDEHGRHLVLETYKEFDLLAILREADWISQPGNLMRRSIYEQVGLLDTSLHFLMDLDYWLRVGLVGRIGYIRKPLAQFRRHSGSKTLNCTDLAAQEIMRVYHKVFQQPDLPESFLSEGQNIWAGAHIQSARAWYYNGSWKPAFREILKAIQRSPRVIRTHQFRWLLPRLIFLSLTGGRESRSHYLYKAVINRMPFKRTIDHP